MQFVSLILAAALDRIVGHSDHLHWGYSDANLGPTEWSKQFAQCGSSNSLQSPIDIVSNETIPVKTVSPFKYFGKCVMRNVTKLPYSYVVYLRNSSCGVIREGKRYALLQIHPHVPAEHRIDGRQYDAEIHFVHSNSEAKLFVIAVLLEKYDSSERWISRYIKMLETFQGEEKPYEDNIGITSLLKRKSNLFSYTGGLTTPPCTGGVTFMVLSEPMRVSRKDFARLMHYQESLVLSQDGKNARPLQPLNDRKVYSFTM